MSFKKTRLGVNIDHFATLRNQREEVYIDLGFVAKILKKCEVSNITIHLREDRRHIKDLDLRNLVKLNILPINLEMAPTNEMLDICKDVKPSSCCLVPEKRSELTTEGGLNIKDNYSIISSILKEVRKNTKTSLFIEPDIEQIKFAVKLGVNAVEIHTGKYAKLFELGEHTQELENITRAANYAKNRGIDVHAGHGLNLENVKNIIDIETVSELNIGYSIVVQSLFSGINNVIERYKKLME